MLAPAVAALALLSAPSPARVGPADLAAIDAFVEAERLRERIPGIALAVVADGRVIHARGFGTAGGGRPVRADTPFLLGSMSKALTAVAVLQLAERARVRLDAPVREVLPEFALADAGAARAITLRQLLQHTSGIPAGAPRAPPRASLEAHVRALSGAAPVAAPGARHVYASPNYEVAGRAVEVASGEPFDAYLDAHVFGPLGMRHSSASPARARAAGLSAGHRYWFGVPVEASLPDDAGRAPAATTAASAADMGRFVAALLGGGALEGRRLLGPEAVRTMLEPGPEGPGFRYAMGLRAGTLEGVPVLHHGGILPHASGKLVLLPEHGVALVLLTNAAAALESPASHRLADALARALITGELPPPGGPVRRVRPATWLALAALALALWQARGLLRAARRVRTPASPHDRRRALAGLALDLGVTVAVLWGLPRLHGVGAGAFADQAPDVAVAVVAALALGLAGRLLGLLRPGAELAGVA